MISHVQLFLTDKKREKIENNISQIFKDKGNKMNKMFIILHQNPNKRTDVRHGINR